MRSTLLFVLFLGVAVSTTPGWAQTGGIRGRVVQATTGSPVPHAQVRVLETDRGMLTTANGDFLLLGVPAGTRRVEVSHLGYRTVVQEVVVRAGATVAVEVQLEVSAVKLDEVVVSGRAAGTARREIGTSVTSIAMEEIETAPVVNVSQLLQSRIAGVTAMPSGGNAGQGTRIVLRGIGSLTQDVEPIIYVDGVRLDNSKESWVSSDAAWTGLDDIDPADIERIEIIKGAAAATLYGTEASAGVIQIFTKQGRGDTQRWSFSTEMGINNTPFDYWDVSIYSPWFYDHFVRNGTVYNHHLSVSGSLDGFSYNLSGGIRGNEGVLLQSGEDAKSFRANMRFVPTERFTIGVNTGYYWRRVQYPEEGNNGASFAYNGLRGGSRGILNAPLDLIGARERFADMGRFTASTNIAFTPIEGFTHRLTVGAEIANWDTWRYVEYGSPLDANGEMYNHRREAVTLNVDYTGRYRFHLTPWLLSSTAFGFQAYSKDEARTRATGASFPAPGLRSVHSSGSSTGLEGRLKQISAGYFGEQQFGFHDVFFLTFGLRADGHSAFGESLGYQFYPKVDASYVLSDYGFWPEAFGTFRLRAAYGTAGQQPGAYASERTWDAIRAFDGEPAFAPGNVGNPDLAPEVSHELEGGFDLGLFEDRLGIEYTYYSQRTENALFRVRYPPSLGFLNTQLDNVAEIRNRGHELGVRGRLVDLAEFQWTARLNLSTNDNEVVSLGGQPPIDVAWSQWIREGYPAGAFFEDRYVLRDGQVVLVEDDYIGQPFPKYTFSIGSDFAIGRNLNISVLVDRKAGHHISSSTTRWLTADRVAAGEPFYDPADPSTARFEPGQPVGNWCLDPSDPIMEATCATDWSINRGNHIHPADSWRLREVGIRYQVPRSMLRHIRASNLTLSLSGRNVWRHQDYRGLEAEANFTTANRLSNQSYFDTPIPRQFMAGATISF